MISSLASRFIYSEEDKLPEYLYAIEIAKGSTWAVKPSSFKDRVFVLRAMREVLDLSMSKAQTIIRGNSEFFPIGTQAEADFVLDLLKSYGIVDEVVSVNT
jgi:hypothetical protein